MNNFGSKLKHNEADSVLPFCLFRLISAIYRLKNIKFGVFIFMYRKDIKLIILILKDNVTEDHVIVTGPRFTDFGDFYTVTVR